MDFDARRRRFRGIRQHGLQIRETVRASPPRRRNTVSATASCPLERIAIVRSSCEMTTRPRSPTRIGWPFLFDDDQVFQVERIGGQRVGQHLVLQRSAVHPADGLQAMFLAEAIGDVGNRQARGDQARRGSTSTRISRMSPPCTVTYETSGMRLIRGRRS